MSPSQKAFAVNFLIVTSVLSFAFLFIMAVAESYVRWKLNQNFTFLGGSGFIGLAILAGAEVLSLVYLSRSER